MDNLRSVLNIVLSKIPTSLIVNSEIQYDNINRDTFVKIAGYYLKYYSNDELDNLFDYIKNEYEDQANYVRGFEIGKYEDKEGFSVFDAILIFATRVLQEIDGEPICRYENVLNTIRHGNYAEMIRNVIKMDILKIQKISPNGNASL